MTTSAREASSRLADLLRREHDALAEFLVALAAFDRERGWAELGHASLFDYLHQRLALSKGAAFYRMTAARLLQDHPEVVEPLRDGRLCLTTIVELSKVLATQPAGDVLPRFFNASKREAKAVVAELAPAPTVPFRAVVTAVRSPLAMLALEAPSADPLRPTSSSAHRSDARDLGQSVHPANQAGDLDQPVHPANRPAAGRAVASTSRPIFVEEPKTAELSRIHVTVPRRLLEKLAAARDAVSHSHPGASEEQILELGLDLILQRHAKRRGLVEKPRAPKAKPNAAEVGAAAAVPVQTAGSSAPSHLRAPSAPRREPIPAHVKRAVWRRDGGRCQWPLQDAGVCGSTLRVQLDHAVPVALGGRPTVENLRCLCAAHNDRAAREVFGDVHIERFARRQAAPAP